MPIDMHTHWVPECLAEALRARDALPCLRDAGQGRQVLHYPGMEAPVRAEYTSIEARLASMDRYGIELQVLSLGNRMLNALSSAPPDSSPELCRVFNDGAAETCAGHPDRFKAFAMLPYNDMAAAVAEFDRAMDLPGIIGVTLPGNGFHDLKTAERFRPVFEAGQRRGAHFMVHDGFLYEEFADPPAPPTDNAGPRLSALRTQSNLSKIMITLCLNDFLDDFPDVSVQVHNLGGNLPMEISRIDHVFRFQGREGPLPSTRFRRCYVDCNSLGSSAIALGVELYGADRIMIGTDGSDFGTEWSLDAIRDARITEEERELIRHGTARRVIANANSRKARAA